MDIDTAISVINSIVALIVSIIALVYTVKTYLLKSGASVRASFGMCSSSVYCEDQYVTSITLENLKDRAIVIFKIYLKIGHNYYLEVEDFGDSPLILKPFEAFKKEYDAIDLYSINMNRIDLNKIFDDKKAKKKIVLSTSDGKYVVSSWIKNWDPVYDFFNNHLTAVIHPRRATYKGKAYGINTKYIVDIKTESGKEEVIPIYPRDYEIKKFKNFRLTKECLTSKENLEEYLYEQVGAGILNCSEISVHDTESWFNETYESEHKKTIEAKYYNWFFYKILGSVLTKYSNYRLRRKNKKAKKANKSMQPTAKASAD
ncbi:hypothetical protein ACFQ0F_06045 [Paraperlucidibaca wandonensis]|uniref:Uncharacterized protein n=1 Tax=Paraperlucidibaca wandonensis TaxID=1268273 RepID=A0ABW3HGE1_9GAMM